MKFIHVVACGRSSAFTLLYIIFYCMAVPRHGQLFWSHHFMANRWGNNGSVCIYLHLVTDLIFLGSKITADGDCSHKIKRCLFLGRKTMTNLDNILKSEILLYDKGLYSQSYGFSISRVQMWELDNKTGWVPQNWCLRTVVLEKTVESPWTARRSNQSILKEISPEYSLEGLMLKLQYFGHLMQCANSLEKTLMLGTTESRKRREWQRMRWW